MLARRCRCLASTISTGWSPDMMRTRTSPVLRVLLPGAGVDPMCSTQSPVACTQPATARATLSSQSLPMAAEVLVAAAWLAC